LNNKHDIAFLLYPSSKPSDPLSSAVCAGIDQDQLKARGHLSKSINCLNVENNAVPFSITVPLW